MVLRFKPTVELLEAREVPANWTWSPTLSTDTDGADPWNWLEGAPQNRNFCFATNADQIRE